MPFEPPTLRPPTMDLAIQAAIQRFKEIQAQRQALSPKDPRQEHLAPIEHGAFAERFTLEHPLYAPFSLLAAIPGYQLAKLLGFRGNEGTGPSLAAMAEGYRGLGRGVKTLIETNPMSSHIASLWRPK